MDDIKNWNWIRPYGGKRSHKTDKGNASDNNDNTKIFFSAAETGATQDMNPLKMAAIAPPPGLAKDKLGALAKRAEDK